MPLINNQEDRNVHKMTQQLSLDRSVCFDQGDQTSL
jgi:hypothetical protein